MAPTRATFHLVFSTVLAVILLLNKIVQGEGISTHQGFHASNSFDYIFAHYSNYIKILPTFNQPSSLVKTLDRKHNNNARLKFTNILNVNSQSAIAAMVPSLRREKDNHLRILDKQQDLKDYRTCVEDISNVVSAAQEQLAWALRMVDAAGKPGPGIMQENVRFLGDYDECMTTETDQRFDTKYCLTTITILKINQVNLTRPFGAQIGLCLPDSCDEESTLLVLNQYFINTFGNGSVYAVQSTCQQKDLELTDKAKAVIVILSVIATLMVLGTLYDILHMQGLWNRMCYGEEESFLLASSGKHSHSFRESNSTHRSEYEPLVNKSNDDGPRQGKLGRLLMSFSVYHNTSKLLSTTPTSGSIDCIHGIRFISMTWVVLGHSIIFGISMMDSAQPYLDMSYGRWTFQVIANALVAVDTFFALSGLLFMYLIMKGLDKTGPSPGFFGQMYFHRFWRLTPPYMLVLMTYVVLTRYVSDGPAWDQHGPEKDECEDSWWTNLLYINNFVRIDKMCMGWSWYLANDMQFFIISPLIFLPIFYLGSIGLGVPFVLLIGNAMASGIITYTNDLSPVLELFGAGSNDYFKMYYIKPYTRIGSYLVGMVTGYFLYKYDCKARIPQILVVLGWIFAAAVALAVQYGMFEETNGNPVTSEVAALYNSLHRIGWGAAICWVIYACANGYGGFVNTLLSWKALVPLSRLTYCAYLVHPLVITFHFASQRRLVYLDNNNVVFSFLGILVLSYLLAYVASMAFEAPMIGVEKALKKQKS